MCEEENNIVWLASFDIGKKNFSFYLEEINMADIRNVPPTPKNARYNTDGTPTPKFEIILDKIYNSGKRILHENIDLTYGCDKSAYLDPEVFHNMTDVLDQYKQYWNKTDIFVVEQQMSFGKNRNTMALKLGQHCYSYFAINYSRFKQLLEFPAYHKTQVLGAPKNMVKNKKGKIRWKVLDKTARKKWAVEKAMNILAGRDDFKGMSDISSKGKKDDYADTLCQAQAAKYLIFVEESV